MLHILHDLAQSLGFERCKSQGVDGAHNLVGRVHELVRLTIANTGAGACDAAGGGCVGVTVLGHVASVQ